MFGLMKSRNEKKSWLKHPEKMNVIINVQDPSVLMKMDMIRLSKEDMRILQRVQPIVASNMSKLVEQFYEEILQVKRLKEIILQHSTIERLQQKLSAHLLEMFSGKIDQDYLDRRLRVGRTHYRIGLNPSWYMGAFQNLQSTLFSIIYSEVTDKDEVRAILSVINKMLSFEQQLVLEAYERETLQMLRAQFERGKSDLQNKVMAISEGLAALAEETQISVESLSTNIQEVNETTTESNELAVLAKKHAVEGGDKLTELLEKVSVIKRFTEEMNELIYKLGESSNQISSVLRIVQGIADQTNLLALNSAIEAARAGEHGKGFAVVSQEVRKLAEQTKHSIAEIHSLIAASDQYNHQVMVSLKQVEGAVQAGILATEQTNVFFQEIIHSIQQSGKTVLTVQGQTGELLQAVSEIEKATASVSTAAEQLNETMK
ncbi:globin-coupled sensor protein [Bacillus sp. B190/17]|uniref:Globin-coupled sensor protein n=2 Tax=Bacillus lumedeiriae TaxID=3058829 RepID=A0ABW8I5G2_9BACI